MYILYYTRVCSTLQYGRHYVRTKRVHYDNVIVHSFVWYNLAAAASSDTAEFSILLSCIDVVFFFFLCTTRIECAAGQDGPYRPQRPESREPSFFLSFDFGAWTLIQ